ncbi:hypothetical protein HMPREF0293_0306 [Corynebacterium glucuronolyticum ATCC 51866]|uniref:Integrase catalytic domain-containing protein n=1 Tax=Corynebacterium glucuronolyticum ATCC 51866 TaxID=548478 RepID=A0ABM9XSR2_9CORY|nr:hypothetical protein HMPREF0293_0306 [Corynebacterium glucuronolyticum ATCC 51866]
MEYIGKLPAVIVPDNASTATYKPRKNSSYRMVTDRYADFGSYYDITIVPTRPGRPRDEATVERAVSIAYKRILGYIQRSPHGRRRARRVPHLRPLWVGQVHAYRRGFDHPGFPRTSPF